MSSLSNWSYTAKATIWRVSGENEYGTKTFQPPEVIDCDYGLNSNKVSAVSGIGSNFTVKNSFWTEYDKAKEGDYILIGESIELDPIQAGADEIKHITQYADTFERLADDFALITGQ